MSSKEQNVARQIEALEKSGIERKKIYVDKQTGKDFNRSAYRKLLKQARPGDVIIIKSIDRLGRNYDEILEQWRTITKIRQVDIFVLDFPLLDTRKRIMT